MRSSAVTIAALAVLLTGLAAPAEARQRWRACAEGPDCTRIRVPLDRSGGLAGSVSLRVARVAQARRPRGALLYLSGGPGGAGVSEMVSVLATLPGVTRRFTVYGFDQRGTGESGLLRCSALEGDVRVRSTRAGELCARSLGPRRSFYTTPDSVEDMEAIRQALGLERMSLLGISYGTALALAYARAHPDRVDRLILDSVADPDDADVFGLASFRAVAPSLRALCPAGCRDVSSDPAADVAALVAKLRARPLRGRVFGRRGPRLTPERVSDLAFDADYLPALRAALPSAVRAALDHDDAAPLQRLIAATALLAAPTPPRDFSSARYGTVCEETPLPWPRGTPLADRRRVAEAAAVALPPGSFFPFDATVAFADEIDLCLRWPDPARPVPAPGGPYPAVPALIVQGEEDLRTPPETSARIAAALPGSTRLVVPGAGHAPLGADVGGCTGRRLLRWLDGKPIGDRCPRVPTGVPAVGVTPSAIGQLAPASGVAGARRGRTVAAVDATLDDVALGFSPAFDLAMGTRGLGLRGGRFNVRQGRLRLTEVVVVPGVRVSGAEGRDGVLRLRIGGRSATPGRVTVSRRGVLRGRLGGRAVRARLANGAPRRATAGFVATVRR